MACVGAMGKMPSLSQADNFNGTTEWTRSRPSLQEGSCSLLTPFPWAPATLILTAAWDRQSLTGVFSEVRKCLLTGFEVPSCLWKVKPQILKSLSAPAQFGDKATSRHHFQGPQTRDRLGSAPSQLPQMGLRVSCPLPVAEEVISCAITQRHLLAGRIPTGQVLR